MSPVIAPEAQARVTYVQLVAQLSAQAQSLNAVRPDLEQQLLQLTNRYRQSKGLPSLKVDAVAHEASVAHAMDMLTHHFMGHVASTGHNFDSRMRALRGGAMVLPSMGENAARLSHADVNDPKAAAKIFQQWVDSAPHRHALLSRDYVKLAVGVVALDGQIYADQIFSGPEVQTNMTRSTQQAPASLY